MTSCNPPSNDATTDTGNGNGTAVSDPDNNNDETESLSSSWGAIEYDFPSVIAAANDNYPGFPPTTVEADDDDDVVGEVEDENENEVVVVDVENAEVEVEGAAEVEDAADGGEKHATKIIDEQTPCSENSSTDNTSKHNNDDNNNTIIQPSSNKEDRERNQPHSAPLTTENDCKNDSENSETPKDDTNNDTKDKENEDSSIQPPDVPVPFVVGLQTGAIIEELKNIFVGDTSNNNNSEDQQQPQLQLQQLQARQRIAVEYAQAEKLAAFADWGAYLRRYEDLQKVISKDDYEKAQQHYLEYGFKEGRDCGPGTAEKLAVTADWGAYLRRYEDLQKIIDKNDYKKARQHYLEYGFNENRDCGPGTAEKLAATGDWGEYLQRYEDLHKAFGDDHEKAQQHYLEYGYQEGRDPSPRSGFVAVVPSVDKLVATADWAAYLRRNTDVQQVCGLDQKKAKEHFLEYGFHEKRYAGPDLRLPPPEARSIPAWSDFHTTR